MKQILKTILAGLLVVILVGCQTKTNEDIVGAWQFETVEASKGDDVFETLDPSTHQSYYGDGTVIYTFKEDGTVTIKEVDGTGASFEQDATWKKDGEKYLVEGGAVQEVFIYQKDSDRLVRVYEESDTSAEYQVVHFIHKRVTE